MTATTMDVDLAASGRRGPAPAAAIRRALPTVALYLASIAVALGLCGLLVQVTGGSATQVFSALLDGAIRSPGAWGLTITTAVPLLVVAIGSIVQGKAGLVNIGQEGQLLLGCAGTAYVGTRLDAPGPVVITAALLFGALLAGLWTLVPAVMKYTRQVPEVISTLLLLFIAQQLADFALTKQWLLGASKNDSRVNNGDPLKANVQLPSFRIFGNEISWGAVIAILLTIGIAVMLSRSTVGFRLRMLGMNQRTARRAGVSAAMVGGGALVLSGVFCGLAGGLWFTSGVPSSRFTSGISSNLGWDGLLVALLARQRAALAVPMAFVFAALRTGSGFLAATGVDRQIADVVQAMLVLALLVPPAVDAIRRRRNQGVSS